MVSIVKCVVSLAGLFSYCLLITFELKFVLLDARIAPLFFSWPPLLESFLLHLCTLSYCLYSEMMYVSCRQQDEKSSS